MEIQARYGIQQTFYFPMIVAGGTNFAAGVDWTPAAADSRIIGDGGTSAQTTNAVVDETGGGWSLTLTASEMRNRRILVLIVDGATKAVEDQCLIISTQFSGQIEANRSIIIGEVETATTVATSTTFEAIPISPNSTAEATADHYNGRLITFTSGAHLGQQTRIEDYAMANGNMSFTVTALTEPPADGVNFVIT